MNAAELQKVASISSVTLYRLQRGTKTRPATIGRIAKALGIDPEEIIEQEVYQ
jgi:DNA-binding Xre family transcriptional regulator